MHVMRNRFMLLLLLMMPGSFLFAQSSYSISGVLRDIENGETLVGANVYLKKAGVGDVTGVDGRFQLPLDTPGRYQLRISYVGYQTIEKTVPVDGRERLKLRMKPTSYQAEEVVVEAERADANVQSTEMSKVKIESDQLQKLPAVLGEPDVLRTVQLLPGVQTTGEGNTGFYVRGGGPDQNLILLDEGVVYNASHLLGFFSVFNADAVDDFTLIKGGIPAEYGGRLSSVLDIKMKDGNRDSLRGKTSVGLLSSKLTLEGPIDGGKGSYMVGGRRTYADVLAQPFLNEQQRGNTYYFYDLNGKANYIFNDKNSLFLSTYFGRDEFQFIDSDESSVANFDFGSAWGNAVASLRWNHVFSDRLFANTFLIYNDYRFDFNAGFGEVDFAASSGITDYTFKSDVTFLQSGVNEMKFGFATIYHKFEPGTGRITDQDDELTQEVAERFAWENALYVQSKYSLNERTEIRAGLRYSLFNQVGQFDDIIYDEGVRTGDTVSYSNFENVQFYDGLEPRLAVRYTLDSTSSLKASYTRMNQYLHLATLSAGSLPTDIWIPSSKYVRPQRATQYAVGYFRNFADNTWEASIEAYYKDMDNQIDFAPGTDVFLNPNLDREVLAGDGWAYGAEFFLKKRVGRTTGWLGYTWSKTRRQIPGINNGDPYPPRYDRRHDINFTMTHTFNDQWEGGLVFVYGTGIAYSLPTGRTLGNYGTGERDAENTSDLIPLYGEPVNAFRFPAYHRADLSAIYKPQGGQKNLDQWYRSKWTFSVYNVYNRKNPYFIFFDTDRETGENVAKMVYLFPILPSVSYSISF